MKAVKVFKPLQVTLFTNGPHVAFMQRIYDELDSLLDRAEKLHVSDELMAEFKFIYINVHSFNLNIKLRKI